MGAGWVGGRVPYWTGPAVLVVVLAAATVLMMTAWAANANCNVPRIYACPDGGCGNIAGPAVPERSRPSSSPSSRSGWRPSRSSP
jgi:hypothetical protein